MLCRFSVNKLHKKQLIYLENFKEYYFQEYKTRNMVQSYKDFWIILHLTVQNIDLSLHVPDVGSLHTYMSESIFSH
jgi:hypothetical protein